MRAFKSLGLYIRHHLIDARCASHSQVYSAVYLLELNCLSAVPSGMTWRLASDVVDRTILQLLEGISV